MSILPDTIERYRKFFGFLIKYWNSDLASYTANKASENPDIVDTDTYD